MTSPESWHDPNLVGALLSVADHTVIERRRFETDGALSLQSLGARTMIWCSDLRLLKTPVWTRHGLVHGCLLVVFFCNSLGKRPVVLSAHQGWPFTIRAPAQRLSAAADYRVFAAVRKGQGHHQPSSSNVPAHSVRFRLLHRDRWDVFINRNVGLNAWSRTCPSRQRPPCIIKITHLESTYMASSWRVTSAMTRQSTFPRLGEYFVSVPRLKVRGPCPSQFLQIRETTRRMHSTRLELSYSQARITHGQHADALQPQ